MLRVSVRSLHVIDWEYYLNYRLILVLFGSLVYSSSTDEQHILQTQHSIHTFFSVDCQVKFDAFR